MLLEAPPPKMLKVPLGGFDFSSGDSDLETLLGSCIGIVLWCPLTRLAGMAHIVLSDSRGDQFAPGKYADTSVPHLRNELLRRGANGQRLISKIAGGATMFGERKPNDVGVLNYAAVRVALSAYSIPVLAEHVGGRAGRVIKFHCDNGKMDVYNGMKLVATI